MMTFTFTVCLVLALFLVLRLRRTVSTERPTEARVFKPYPAATIVHDDRACRAVKSLGKQRFLAWDVPDIPVAKCTREHCRCRYECFADRRVEGGERRLNIFNAFLPNGLDKRGNEDRRRDAVAAISFNTTTADLAREAEVMAREVAAQDGQRGPCSWEGQEWSSMGRLVRMAGAQQIERF